MAPNMMEGKLMRKCDIQIGRARKIIRQAMENLSLDPSIVWTKELEAECLRLYEEQGPDPAPKALWEYMYPELCTNDYKSDRSVSSSNDLSVTETDESEHSSGPLKARSLENAKPSALKARQRHHRRSVGTTTPKVRKSIKANRPSIKESKDLADCDVPDLDESEACRSPKTRKSGSKTPKSAKKDNVGRKATDDAESGIDWLPFENEGEGDHTGREQSEKQRRTPKTPKKEKVKRADDSEGLDFSDEFDIHEVFDTIDASEAFDPFDDDEFEAQATEENHALPKKMVMVAKKPLKKSGNSRRASAPASPEKSVKSSGEPTSPEKPRKIDELSDEDLLMELLRRKEERRASTGNQPSSPKKHEPTFDGQVPELEETSDTDSSDEGKAKTDAPQAPRRKPSLDNDQEAIKEMEAVREMYPQRRLTRKAPVQV